MPQSLANVLLHLVFSTRDRTPLISAEIEPELHAYMATIFNESECPALLINGANDHVHILFALTRTSTIADIVNRVKSNSSKWIKTKGAPFFPFAWQAGYGVFSVGQTDRERVMKYIENQKVHHQKQTFVDEYRDMLRRARIEFDERYVWD